MVGKRIRQARQKRHLSQAELAYLVGVSPTTVSRWERGHTIPRSRAHLEKIKAVLGLDLRRGR